MAVGGGGGSLDAGTGGGSMAVGGGGGSSVPLRVLFDGAHKQQAGNADWVIDTHSPDPMPAMPSTETSWNGGISAWGFDLFESGRYQVHQLATGQQLTWGGGGVGDLQQYSVFISDEPELEFAPAEQSALLTFVQSGGGVFLVSDHAGAVRCSSCIEAWRVINGFLEQGANNVFGLKCDGNNVGASGLTGAVTTTSRGAFFSGGRFGAGSSLIYHSGSTVSLVQGQNAAEVVVTSSAGGMMAAAELPSGGRLVLMGDSSPADDGTCQCSASLQRGWAEGTDRSVILNATAWLAHDAP